MGVKWGKDVRVLGKYLDIQETNGKGLDKTA